MPIGESLLLCNEAHFGGRLAHGDHEAHDGVVVTDYAGEVPDGAEVERVSALDLNHDLPQLAVDVPEVDETVDSLKN